MGRLMKSVLIILVLALVVLLAWFVAQLLKETPQQPLPDPAVGEQEVGDDFGLENITTLEFGNQGSSSEIDVTRARDDRLTIPAERPVGADAVLSEDESVPRRLPRLTRLFAGEVAGYRIDENIDGSWTVKLTEMGTGDRYRISTNPYALQLISRGEVKKVLESHLFANDSVLLLYEGDDETTVKSAFVPYNTVVSDTGLQRFEDNIRATTNNENGLFFTHRVNGKTVGLVVDVANPGDTNMVWQSGFSHWIPRWGRSSYITIATPITSLARGKTYLLDPDTTTQQFHRVVEPLYGGSLFFDSDSGHFVLYEVDRGDFVGKTVVTDLSRKDEIEIPVTLPEKCDGFNGVFVCAVPEEIPYTTLSGYDTVFPDSWYQGDISFLDAVLLINVATGEVQRVMTQNERDIRVLSGGELFDIIHPRISEDGKYLFFVNKNTLSLWMLRIF